MSVRIMAIREYVVTFAKYIDFDMKNDTGEIKALTCMKKNTCVRVALYKNIQTA